MMSQDILIVDDEIDICRLISATLEDEGYHTRHALDGAMALEAIQARCPHLVILDIWLGDSRCDGIKLLELIQKSHPHLPVVMMSGHGTIETAVQAIKMGAYDFIEKPFKAERLLLAVYHAIEAAKLRRENSELKARAGEIYELSGHSYCVNQLRQLVERVAPTNSRVLIFGPSGTGKEIVARLLHQKSKRKSGPFVVLNCANLDPARFESVLFGVEDQESRKIGLFEQAHRGTILLDEVTDMPLETQGKILRSLQEQTFMRIGGKRNVEVDVRVIASSSRDLKKAVEEKRFREDLYYRLNVVPIKTSPLKERKEDIPILLEELMNQVCRVNGLQPKKFSEEAILALQSYEWPGNIRQLKNVVEWVLIMSSENESDLISVDLLPSEIYGEVSSALRSDNSSLQIMSLPLREARENFEKSYLSAQVERFGGNITRTANFIQMERSALHRKLKELQIKS
jgi:two-component system nitrogen regulation response regulator NtrX